MRALLAFLAVVIAAVAVGLGLSAALHHRPTNRGPAAGGTAPAGVPGSTTVPVDIVPGSGQTFVSGTASSFTADNAVGPPLTPPFTITIPSRGQGSADITGVLVGGKDVEIYWYGGQPLPVGGTGQLAVDGGPLTVDPSGATWMLDGPPRSLTTGHFTLGAPVAVGSGGLAQPYQSIAFDAGVRSTLQTTGHAQVHQAPAGLHVTGPGSVTIHGNLQVQTAAGTRHVQSVTFGPGSYDVNLAPAPGGDTITGTLQGPVSFS